MNQYERVRSRIHTGKTVPDIVVRFHAKPLWDLSVLLELAPKFGLDLESLV